MVSKEDGIQRPAIAGFFTSYVPLRPSPQLEPVTRPDTVCPYSQWSSVMLSHPIPFTQALNQVKAPVHGRAACGFPSPAEEYAEPPLSLDDLCGVGKPSLFILIAWGDSMSGLGVYDGDYLVVDRAIEPKVGSVVVARIGPEFTVKTYGMVNGQPVLEPANPDYDTIVIGEFEESEVWGVVLWNLHKLHD